MGNPVDAVNASGHLYNPATSTYSDPKVFTARKVVNVYCSQVLHALSAVVASSLHGLINYTLISYFVANWLAKYNIMLVSFESDHIRPVRNFNGYNLTEVNHYRTIGSVVSSTY